MTLRNDVKFHSGDALRCRSGGRHPEESRGSAEGQERLRHDVLREGLDDRRPATIRLNFKGPAPERQITDLLQFVSVIDPAGIDTVETKPAGTGAYHARRARRRAAHRPQEEPELLAREASRLLDEVVLTIFSRGRSASAALESGAVDLDLWRHRPQRRAPQGCRLPADPGPGPLVQVFRINSDPRPVQECEIPSGLQLPDGPAGHPARRLCGLGRSRRAALGSGEPRLRQVLQRDLRLQSRQGEEAARRIRPQRERDEQLEAPGERQRPAVRGDQPGRPELARRRPASTSSSTFSRAPNSSMPCSRGASTRSSAASATSRSSRPAWRPTASIAPPTIPCSETRIRIPNMSPRSTRVNTTVRIGRRREGRLRQPQ